MVKRILVTGGSGQVGIALCQCDWSTDIELVTPTRGELDLADAATVMSYVSGGRFAAVINTAAYTAVDQAESDVIAAWRVNALAPAALATAAKATGIPIVHTSTDYVFDGRKTTPYHEDDPVGPLGVYGASKEAGEQAVRTANPLHVIVRTAWLFSPHGSNFVKTMLRNGAQRDHLRVVADQVGSPTGAFELANAIQIITTRLISDKDPPVGTYHFVNRGEATWYSFAKEIFRQQTLKGFNVPHIEAIKTSEYVTAARRPRNSRLSTSKLARDFGITPGHWTDALQGMLTKIK